MATTSSKRKTHKTDEPTIPDPNPLYAVVGAGDVAVATLRTARVELSARAAKLSPKALREQAQARVAAGIEAVQAEVQAAPHQVKELPIKAQVALNDAVSTALSTYGELSGRGKSLVTRVRRQEATVDLEQQAKVTVAKVKAASTTTKKSASATATAAKSARTTTRKSASRAKSATKSATTSAKKTATAARKAAQDSAAKVGD